MKTESIDLLVLGAGNAGQAAASAGRRAGWTVALVETRDVGGTCPLRGCVPKKVLVAAASVLDTIARAKHHAIDVGPAKLDWAGLIARERTFVEGVPKQLEASLAKEGVEVIHGHARFVGPHAVMVRERKLDASAEAMGMLVSRRFMAKKIVIATGSAPRALDVPGAELAVTSDDVLENPELPNEVIFLGAGVIAFEFAHVFARAGAKVTMLQRGDRALGRMERACVDRLVELTRGLGVRIEFDVDLQEIARAGNGFVVRCKSGRSFTADRVVNATGRVAQVEDLDLAAGGISHDGERVLADEFLRSASNADVFVAGDALASAPQLSALATHMGAVAGKNAVTRGPLRAIDLRPVSQVVFTIPELASVGMTEEAARKAGRAVDVQDVDMRSWRSTRTYAERDAYARVIVDQKTGELLGAHMLGHGGAELIYTFAAIIARRGKASELAEPVYPYPTFHSDLKYFVD
jgi:glutathione reductase (NADPH)